MYDTDALTVSLPWLIDETERSREVPWDYLTRRRMDVAELFAPNVDAALGAYLSATAEER